MQIKKIALSDSGFKGITVAYLREEQKNGRPFINEVIEKRKHPIHLSLETMFKDLRFHLLDITGMLRGDEDKMTKDYTIMESEVVAIEFDASGFTIIGEKKVFMDKYIKLKTCRVEEEDNYEHFDTVQKLIESIVEETKEYMAGTKKVDDIEVAVRFIQAGKHKTLTEDSLKGFSPQELKDFAVKLLESNFGAVVMMDEDMNVSAIDVTDINAEIEAKNNKVEVVEDVDHVEVEEVEVGEEEVVIPVPVKKTKAKAKEIELPVSDNVTPMISEEVIIKPAF